MNKQIKTAICLALTVLCVTTGTSITTFASTEPIVSNNIENKIKNLESITGTNDMVNSFNTSDEYNEVNVKAPKSLSEPIKITDNINSKTILKLNLPDKNNNVKAIESENGTIVYNATNNVDFAIQPTINGFRSLININNADAPKEYKFKLDLPDGSKLVSAEKYLGKDADTKEVFVVNSNNVITSIFAPAWAKDANGKNVSTYYKIEGNTLIQVVNFNKDSAFPIVADPDWWKVTKCAAAITMVVGSVALPALKIAKIRKYIKALGGVKEAAMLLVGATSAAEKGEAVTKALAGLASEITGISEIQDQCFS